MFHFIRVANAVAGFEVVINQDPGVGNHPGRVLLDSGRVLLDLAADTEAFMVSPQR